MSSIEVLVYSISIGQSVSGQLFLSTACLTQRSLYHLAELLPANPEAMAPPQTCLSAEKPRRKWTRKAPLISKGVLGRDPSIDPGSMESIQFVISHGKGKNQSFAELRNRFLHFLQNTSKDAWDEKETHRRFYIFGEYVTCVRWQGEFYITSQDIFKIQRALYKLDIGKPVQSNRKLEETLLTQLRGLNEGAGMIMEDSKSSMINFLHSIRAIKTRKRQKIFKWDAVDHQKLYHGRVKKMGINQANRVKAVKNNGKSFVIKSFKLFKEPKTSMNVLLQAADALDSLDI